ncbi:5-formyltetrahydrofolate cyclo-ligase [Shinella sp. BYT-45]|uniref:5-formyltetrahydrofolate cyclo-ligase n=1 Tax=Shinella sp. BYT-45 TaxID=3377377 RepID=UPI00398098E0
MADDDTPATFASPACFLHEVDPAYAGLPGPLDLRAWTDVNRWRKGERERLIAERLAVPAGVRAAQGEAIAVSLLSEIGDVEGRVISAYWPFRGEPDLRALMRQVAARGGLTALPVVVGKGRPLEFHLWRAGAALARGVWNIPIPAEPRPCVPDVVIAPVVGYDPTCYRLGYGGGFFDRTLAALPARPRVIGVGSSTAQLATIYPQLHDIPMDMIVTEAGVVRPQAEASTVRALT